MATFWCSYIMVFTLQKQNSLMQGTRMARYSCVGDNVAKLVVFDKITQCL